jgi:hypothetical protein
MKPRITIEDIHHLDIRMRHSAEKPEHEWQVKYICHWVKTRNLGQKFWNMVHEAEKQRATWAKAIYEETADFQYGLDSMSDAQMRGEQKLTPCQVAYLRLHYIEPRVAPDGLYIRPIPFGERGHVAWLCLENRWERRMEQETKVQPA